MPTYMYRAMTKQGQIVRNRVEANSRQSLIKTLKTNDLLPIVIEQLAYRNKKAQHLANATADATTNTSMKMMKIIMPIIMVFFAFSSSASFGIYLLASSLSSILIGEITSPIINKLTKKQQKEVEEVLEKEANRMIKKGKLQEK